MKAARTVWSGGKPGDCQSKGYLSLYWEVLIGNCDSRLFLGGADETTLKYISNSLGKETIRAVSNSRSWSRQSSYSQNYNKTGRELMTENELSVMDNNNCVLFIRGEYPFFCTKYPLERHPSYKRSGDANDKYLYDVSEKIHTGINRPSIEQKDKYTQVFEEAQQADSRESERQHRHYSRPMERYSARGRRLGEPQTLMEASRELVREKMPVPPAPEEDLAKVAAELVEESFDPQPVSFEEGGSELIEDTLGSYLDFWSVDASGEAEGSSDETEAQEPDELETGSF